jgi:hypothetical protein
MNQTRTCGNCGAVFCIDDRGHYVVEEASLASWLRRMRDLLARHLGLKRTWSLWKVHSNEAQSLLLAPWWRVPRRWRVMVSAVSGFCVAVLCVCWGFTTWSMRDEVSMERAESLQVRSEIACQALLLGDDAVLIGLATRDSQEDARRWLLRMRPAHWPQSADLARTAQVDLRTLFKSLKTQRAAVYYTIHLRPDRTPDAAADIAGTLCWSLGHDGRWQLDGRRTLEELSSARRTD